MIDEHIQPDVFRHPLHTFLGNVKKSMNQLLETFKSQFVQDETSIGTTHLTKLQIDTGDSEPVSQRPYPITMKHYDNMQVLCSSHSSWLAPIIRVPKGNGRKCLVIDYGALNKVTKKFVWPVPKIKDIFSKLNGAKYFSTFNLLAGYQCIPFNECISEYCKY